MSLVSCTLCPECHEIVSRECEPQTLIDDAFPLDSNEVDWWECGFCGFSQSQAEWSHWFAGVPQSNEIRWEQVEQGGQRELF